MALGGFTVMFTIWAVPAQVGVEVEVGVTVYTTTWLIAVVFVSVLLIVALVVLPVLSPVTLPWLAATHTNVDAVLAVSPKPTAVPEHRVALVALVILGRTFTTIFLVAVTTPHAPCAVRVRVTGVDEFAAAVKVTAPGVPPVLLALKVPLGADHRAPVDVPPKEPPNVADVPPWQMAVVAAPAFTVHCA